MENSFKEEELKQPALQDYSVSEPMQLLTFNLIQTVKALIFLNSNPKELLKLLNLKIESDKKVWISGKCFQLNMDSKKQHVFEHQVSSMTTQCTQSTQQLQSQVTNLIQQDPLQQNQSDQNLLIQSSKIEEKEQKCQFTGFDMSKVMAEFKLEENDDLLMIDDLDIPQPNNSTCNNTPSPSKELSAATLQKPDQIQESSRIQQQDTNNNKIIKYELTPGQEQQPAANSNKRKSEEDQVVLKRHNTDMPMHLTQFLVSMNPSRLQTKTNLQQIQTQSEIVVLQQQLNEKSKEVVKLKETLSKISQSLAKIYSSPQLLQKDIEDKELLEILSSGFMSQAKLHLAFLFSSPLIIKYKDEYSNELKSQTMIAIDHEKEFNGVVEGFKETGNHIRYRRIPATLDNLRVSLTENPIALHFSGHGIENNKENFGRDSIYLRDEGNFLVIEDNEGCAQFLSEKRLHELLEASGTKLEFVFVASCYSQFAGEIFHNAGAKHVICVRKGFQISDKASILFSKAFYHALFSQTVTVCQAFELAKATLHAEKEKALAEEAKKFVLLKDSDELEKTQTIGLPMMMPLISTYRCKKHKCTVFGPFSKGQALNVGQEPMFRLEISKVEDFLGRRKEMQEIISDIYQNRLVTVKGIPGIGKTTLAKAIAYYLDERHTYKDGIILLSLRGLDQANMILTRLRLIISQHQQQFSQEDKKDDKSLENFTHISDKIIKFLKDKEVLIVLDNAEDPLKKDGNCFREIIQNLLVNCPKLKMLLTSRYPIGHFADVSEKIFALKELPTNYAIDLLFKKAMRPIKESEIQELLQSAVPERVLHFNPLVQKKDSKKLEEHHMFHLLGGHPHAISLAAPLLQDKSLKELYALLNSNEIMDWLRIEGIEGTPLASLKVSLDTSIQHMKVQEPQAIKLFCMIGLLPGGCTENDLNQLWGNGWLGLAEKLLRASLLVKKNGTNGDNVYSLFPFMNQYASSLLQEENKIQEHKRICIFLSKICQELLKQQITNEMRMNKLVQFETNIWACIYRSIDRQQTQTPYGEMGQSTLAPFRGKSPGIPKNLIESTNSNCLESGNDSSFSDPDKDYYDQILSQRPEESQRSKSEINKMRGLNKNEERQLQETVLKAKKDHFGINDEDEVKTLESQELEEEEKSEEELKEEKFHLEKGIKKRKSSYTQPQSLMQSQENDFHKPSKPGFVSEYLASEQEIYVTSSMANLLSDYNGTPVLKNTQDFKRMGTGDSSRSIDESQQFKKSISRNLEQDQEESFNYNRNSSSNEITPGNQQNDSNSLSNGGRRTYQEISYQRLQQLPSSSNNITMHQFDDDNQSLIPFNDFLETSSIDSLQNQLLSQNNPSNLTYSQDSFLMSGHNQRQTRRRKSVYSAYNSLYRVDETIEESSIIGNDENNDSSSPHNNCNVDNQNILDGITEEIDKPILVKNLSSKKYSEDQKFEKIADQQRKEEFKLSQEVEQYENLSGQEGEIRKQGQFESKLKKKNIQKRVIFQEEQSLSIQPQQQQNNSENKNNADRSNKTQSTASHSFNPIIENFITRLTPDGSLMVFYITNLVVLSKYDEASKAIEQFGLKTQDQLCIANLKKLQGYIIHIGTNNHKESQQKYEEALKIFQQLKIWHGQASCNAAIGYLLYTQSSLFINKKMNEHKIFLIALKRFEESIALYSRVNHFAGEAFCHKILQFIKQKLGENYIENQRKMKNLNQKVKSQLGYYEIIQNNQEASLFLEIVQQNQNEEQQLSLKNYNNQANQTQQTSSSAKRIKEPKQKEEIKQPTNISNIKKQGKLLASQFPQKMSYNNEIENQKLLFEQIATQRRSELGQIEEAPQSSIKQSLIKIQQRKKTDEQKEKELVAQKKATLQTDKRLSIKGKKDTKTEQELVIKDDAFIQSTEQQNQLVVSDNENGPLTSRTKKKIPYKEMAQSQIKKYKESRNEKMSKKPLNSSSFIGSSQQEEPKIKEVPSTRKTTINNKKKPLEEEKKETANSNSKTGTLTSNGQQQFEEMIFERASDLESGVESGQDAQNDTFRESLNVISEQSNLKMDKQLKRPATSMGISQGKDSSSFKGKRGKVDSKVKFSTFNSKKLSIDKSLQIDPISPGRTISPSSNLKKHFNINSGSNNNIQQSQPQQQQQITIKENGVMEVQITTTSTVKIIGLPQIKVEHKPEITIESLDNEKYDNQHE